MPGEQTPAAIEPKTDGLKVKGSLVGSFDAMLNRLSTLQLFSMKATPDELTLVRVESRDIQKRPFIFVITKFTRDSIEMQYTIALDASPKLRRLAALKTLLSVLSLVNDLYHADETELFQHVDSAIDGVMSSLSQSYSSLFNNYDSLSNEYRETKRLNIELQASNKNLTVQAAALSEENKALTERLKGLESYSDEALMVMVEDWLYSHDSTIDINEFAKTFKMVPTRVEQILTKMGALGYIELKG